MSRRPSSCSGLSSIAYLALISAVVVLGLAAWLQFRSAPAVAPGAEGSVVDELEAARVQGAVEPPPRPPRGPVAVRRTVEPPSPSEANPNDASVVSTAASPDATEAVSRLVQLDTSKPLTREQAAAVKGDLEKLVEHGVGSIPAIRQFLQQNRDLSLDETKGSSPVGYASLRAGLFDSLRQIGGSEAQFALADTLRTTGDPAEVALLVRHLEALAPGEYREQAVAAARETLNMAMQAGNETKPDVGPLFKVLQQYGDAGVLSEIQSAIPKFQHYGLMTLAGLPEGQGIPALVAEAQQTGVRSSKSVFALELLAQVAPQYEEANAALLQQAQAGQIPDHAWQRIGEALSGQQYQFVTDPNADLATVMRIPGTRRYHIGGNNENFFTTPFAETLSEPDRGHRLDLIDQLLAANSQPAAAQALQKAKARLSGPGN